MEQKHMAGTASGAANHACTSLAELIASSVWWEAASVRQLEYENALSHSLGCVRTNQLALASKGLRGSFSSAT